MENCCKFCGRTTKYGCTLCDNKVCVICADESKVDESGYNEENHQVGKCPRGACNNNNNNDSKADADDIDVKTAAAKSTKKSVGNIVSGNRVNIFNYFGTAQKGKLCVAQKMKMDTLISDINDINSSKENENPSNLDKTVETSNISFKEKQFEGKCYVHPKLVDLPPWTQKKLFQNLSRGYSTTKMLTMLKIRSQKLVTGIM